MSGTAAVDHVQNILSDIDRLMSKMLQVRRRVSELCGNRQNQQLFRSVREIKWLGVWADRENMQGLSSRE
ncbi:MAG: hypothetical protein ONB44_21565 [candidate division KSB1 bacterium]|nr:hypothetical protein [candidate division KSB1 bacterium]MDZ7304725.1 hypothetical protein [candidate division KSB1 bacterium]MDZ7312780.1 hypothetical protein [candidate division KSB1 bacterium]